MTKFLAVLLSFLLINPAYAAFSCSQPLTVDGTKVPSSQTGFAMLVSDTSASLKTVANGGNVQNANGYDIGFFTGSDCTGALPFELRSFTATTGATLFWVKLDLNGTPTNTTFYRCYGDSSIITNQSSTSTWSAYKGVYHLDGSLELTDSSAQANALTQAGVGTNSVTSTAGAIGNGAAFAATSIKFLKTLGAPANITYTAPESFCGWYNFPSTGGLASVHSGLSGNNGNRSQLDAGTPMRPDYTRSGVTNYVFGSLSYTASTWAFMCLTVNAAGTSANGYIGVAGGSLTSQTGLAVVSNTTDITTFALGARTDDVSHCVSCKYDEIKFAASQLSTDWVTTMFNSEANPSTFYSVGAATCSGGMSSGTMRMKSVIFR